MKFVTIKQKDQEHPDVQDATLILLSDEHGLLSVNMTFYKGEETIEEFKERIDDANEPQLIACFSSVIENTTFLEELYKLVFDDFVIYFQRIISERTEEPTNESKICMLFGVPFSAQTYKLHFDDDKFMSKFQFLDERELKRRLRSRRIKSNIPIYIDPDIAEQVGVK